MSEKGVTDFEKEKACGKLHLDFEKLEHVIQPAWSTGVYGENYRR